jgi:hypothetical protein
MAVRFFIGISCDRNQDDAILPIRREVGVFRGAHITLDK